MKCDNNPFIDFQRRSLLKGSAAMLLMAATAGCSVRSQKQWIVSACSDYSGGYFASAIDQSGRIVSQIPLPGRGHDTLAIPDKPGHALIFSRRPGHFLIEADFVNGRIVRQVESQPDSHFYGHGVLSADGAYLFTTENHFDDGKGIVVVRDTHDYQVLERFDSGGVGPHELALMPDGKTLVIANGGIQTHPDFARVKLNLDSMRPNLAYIQSSSGQILDRFEPPDHLQSIRHLDVRKDGKVLLGVQYQGTKSEIVPLVYSHHGEAYLQPFSAPEAQWRSMNQYTASVLVVDHSVFISCPRGGYLTQWNVQNCRFTGRSSMTDVSGLAMMEKTIMASSGQGKLQPFQQVAVSLDAVLSPADTLRFDNHMTTIMAA